MKEDIKVKLAKITEDAKDETKKVFSYLGSWESSLYDFPVAVKAPYCITENEHGKSIIAPEDKEGTARNYNAFNETDLLRDAAKVNIDEDDSILEFCNKYGLFYDEKGSGYLVLETFVKEIKDIKELLNLFYIIQEEDTVELKIIKDQWLERFEQIRDKAISTIDDAISRIDEEIKHFQSTPPIEEVLVVYRNHQIKQLKDGKNDIINLIEKPFNKVWNKSALTLAKEKLIHALNLKIEASNGRSLLPRNKDGGIYPILKLGKDGNFIPSYTSTSLLSLIYFEIFEVVIKNKPLENCLKCGSLFTSKKAGIKFCPSNNGKRSSCENSYNQMVYKSRKAIASGKKTIEDICINTGRDINEISSWIEKS